MPEYKIVSYSRDQRVQGETEAETVERLLNVNHQNGGWEFHSFGDSHDGSERWLLLRKN